MKPGTRILAILFVTGLLLIMATGCDWLWKTPTPTPTPAAPIPAEVLAAHDAALAYLRRAYPDQAPPEGIAWMGRDTTPKDTVGSSSYEFTNNPWLMNVRVPLLAPGKLLYEMELMNSDTGLHWTGRLNESWTLLESNLNVAVEVLIARDLILAYLRANYQDQAPAEGLAWVGERTTPEGSLGHEACRFTADDWLMDVEYDVVQPDQMVYHVEARNSSTQFVWRGQVDAQGVVLEERLPA